MVQETQELLMKTFKQYLKENFLAVLFEGKELHQFVNQYGDKILQTYSIKYDNSNIPKEQQTQHKSDFIEHSLGIHDMPLHHKGWILRQVVKGNIPHLEDLKSTVRSNLTAFETHKDAHKINLERVNNPTELFHIAQKHDAEKTTEDVPASDFTLHGENEHWKVVQPHTKEASCTFGKGTNWCTAAKEFNPFEDYNKDGPLMILLPKKPLYRNEKYQYHDVDDGQFMNKQDMPVNSSREVDATGKKIPSLPRLSFADRPLPEFNHPSRIGIQARILLRDPNSSKRDLNNLLNDPKFNLENHLNTAVKSPHEFVSMAAVNHPKLDHTTPAFRNAIRSQHESVALAAMKHPKFGTPEHITIALNSRHDSVGLAAMNHSGFDALGENDHLLKALDSKNTSVAMAAMEHPEFDPGKHLPVALSSKNGNVALAAINHPSFDAYDHLESALISDHSVVRRKAKEIEKKYQNKSGSYYPNSKWNLAHEARMRALEKQKPDKI
jgi:hypothetical protein